MSPSLQLTLWLSVVTVDFQKTLTVDDIMHYYLTTAGAEMDKSSCSTSCPLPKDQLSIRPELLTQCYNEEHAFPFLESFFKNAC